MTEYIITEELWNRILHTLWDCQEVNLCVRIREESRIYQNQREEVLDEVLALEIKGLSIYAGFINPKHVEKLRGEQE
jgi:hypothetical protein